MMPKNIGKKIWRVVLSIFSILAIFLALFLFAGMIEVGTKIIKGDDVFFRMTMWILFAIAVVSAFIWAGNYLSIQGIKLGKEASKSLVSGSFFSREFSLLPIIKIFILVGIGCALATSVFYLYSKTTNSTLVKEDKIAEVFLSAQEPFITYYFDANVSNKISSEQIRHNINANHLGGGDAHQLDDYARQIESIFYTAKLKPTKIYIVGYADESGNNLKNLELSKKRANTVFLLFQQIPEEIIEVRNGGIKLNSCNQADIKERILCRSKDRRVEVYFNQYQP